MGRFGGAEKAEQDSSLGDPAGGRPGSPAGWGRRCSTRGRLGWAPAACSPRGRHGAAVWDRDPANRAGPWGKYRPRGGEVRMTSNRISGVHFPGEGSFWFLPRQEGKQARNCSLPVFIQFHRQLR